MPYSDANDANKMIDVPVNQHTGPHWAPRGPVRESDNSITVNAGAKEYLAMDAYIMSAKMKNGKVMKKLPGVYDIGVVRCKIPNGEYTRLGLKNLELPSM